MAQWRPGAADPFYSFNKFMLNGTNNPKTQLGFDFIEDNKDVAFNRQLAKIGFGQADTSPLAEFARKQQQQAVLGYKTALAENPMLSFQSYLNPLNRQLFTRMFQRLSPTERGENQTRFVGPVRTIADM